MQQVLRSLKLEKPPGSSGGSVAVRCTAADVRLREGRSRARCAVGAETQSLAAESWRKRKLQDFE